jgi:photosystem II stability/assembly factor-like uncharacterized protein
MNKYLHFVTYALLLLFLTGCAAAPYESTWKPQLGFHVDRGDAQHISAARAAGGTFSVIVFGWDTIQPEPNHFYWEVSDAALRTAEFYGLEVVARLDRPPAWALDDSSPTPWNLDAYAAFVNKVVGRYGERLAGVIIWNEPNLSLEWNNGAPSAQDYASLLKTGYQAAKSAAPEVPVLLAGLAFTEGATADASNDLDFLQAVYDADGGDSFDILAAHPYGFGQPPAALPNPSTLNFRRLELHRAIMEANGDGNKPIWITEMGWRTSAPNPEDRWQVVSPQQQTTYTLDAAEQASSYDWLERMTLWELNTRGDDYGYYLWHGDQATSPLYESLVESCGQFSAFCGTEPALLAKNSEVIEILAPDVIIRLGDRGTLHPHWVHLHQGGEEFSPDWTGEFFLTAAQAAQSHMLMLETMQVDQPTNRLFINGQELATLQTRTRPDPTSTWAMQRFQIPAQFLQPGLNMLRVTSGLRNPAHQYGFWRWENFQFRNIRLTPVAPAQQPWLTGWQPVSSPSGWSETNRLRKGLDNDFWLTGNRTGELWRGTINETAAVSPVNLVNQAENRVDLVFTDVLPLVEGTLVSTDRGLLWRAGAQARWQAVPTAPQTYAYTVTEWQGTYYAGFETMGLWAAPTPTGPWQSVTLPEEKATVLDIKGTPDRLFVATDQGIYSAPASINQWQRLSGLPGEAENPLKRFMTRLFVGQQNELIVRNLDQLWQYNVTGSWQPFGPSLLHENNKVTAVLNCCQSDTLIGTNFSGLWQLSSTGEWQPLEQAVFTQTDVVDLIQVDGYILAAGLVALLYSDDGGQNWQKANGLPQTVSDLLIDPGVPDRWFAATPAGIYRSEDAGEKWLPVSPPWIVWDMAFGPDGKLLGARTGGIVWTDNTGAETIRWEQTDGLDEVLFFSVTPHPEQPELVVGGTWGNNLGVSRDNGVTMESIHNGLETLSVLATLWHPTDGQLTVGTIEGLYRSDDAGQSWFKLPGALVNQTVYALLQTDDGHIWTGAADGLWVSGDYGVTWQQETGMPPVTVMRLGQINVGEETWLWAGTEEAGLWISPDNGNNWRLAGLPVRSVYNVVVNPNGLVVATDRGLFTTGLPESAP